VSSQKRSATAGAAQGRGTRATGTTKRTSGVRAKSERPTRATSRPARTPKPRTAKPGRPRTEAASPDEPQDERDAAFAAEHAARIEDSRRLALAIVEAALDKKAVMPALLDVSTFGTYTDFLLVLSGRSDRHVGAVAEGIQQTLAREHGARTLGTEGTGAGTWVLLDFGGVVVHVFYHPLREHYDLESLWMDAPRVPLQVPDEAMIPPQEAY
jgi:ribosome-associated protein